MKPDLLIILPIAESFRRMLADDYVVHYLPDAADREALLGEVGTRVRAVLTNGSMGIDRATMDRLQHLEFVGCLGAGYENIDLAAARERKITVTHGPGTNDKCVADHAMALMLAVVRGVALGDRAARGGRWSETRLFRPMLTGRRLGVVGLGAIGIQIAKRAAAFDMPIAYHNRRPRHGVPYRYVPNIVELARESDVLVAACPGGAATRHLIDAGVMAALGREGFIVNIARGSVVDTAALISALRGGIIAGAGLDVVEGEPEVPSDLAQLDNVVLTPHIAGRSPETAHATFDLFRRNLRAHFAGQAVLTPVPA